MKTATKRITAFLITVLIALATCFPASAATSRVDGYEGGSMYDNFYLGQSQDPDNLIVHAGDEIRIPLTADMFTYSDGKVPVYMEAMTYSQLSTVRVSSRVRSGSGVLDYVQFDRDSFAGRPFIRPGGTTFTSRTAYISVMFARDFISIEDQDFAFTLYLSIDGKAYDDVLSIELAGTMQVRSEVVDKDTIYIDLSDDIVAEATGSVKDICAYLGAGVHIYTNMHEGQKYCGKAKVLEKIDAYLFDRDLANLEVGVDLPELYSDIVMIYKLQSIDLRRPSSKVRIDKDHKFYEDRTYHVYDEDLRYVGVIEDPLPYSNFYFVAEKRLPQFDALPINQ